MNASFAFRLGLLVLTAIRLVVAARSPLSADEAYYWVWSRALAPGYLDHPPMVALWIRAGTAIAGDTALGVRLLGPVSALLGSLLLMRAAEDFWASGPRDKASASSGRSAGVVAAMLLNATLVLNVGAVVMTPDTPLLFFWTAALACLGRLVRGRSPNWWLGVGLCAGLALDSKYTACLLGAGIAVWLVAVPDARRWLRCWQLWAGGAVALTVFAPVLAWNAAHGWVSFTKQGGRTGDWHPGQAWRFVVELVGGQIGLATPGVAWVLGVGLVTAGRAAWRRESGPVLLACLTLLPAAVFLQHALGGRVQANWPAIIYPGAALAASGMPARFWRQAAWLGLACALVVYVQAAGAPFPLPRALDFTLIRLAGWSDLAGEVYAAERAAKVTYVAADEYGLASELAWHLHGPVAGAEPRWALFRLPVAPLDGQPVLLVRSMREAGEPDRCLWSGVREVGGATRARHGVAAERYRFYVASWRPCAARLAPPPVLLPASRSVPRS